MAVTSAGDGSSAVRVAIVTSVGNAQTVVMFTELVMESGTGSHMYVSVVVGTGAEVGGFMGVKVPVWPGGPMQMYFLVIVFRFAQSAPIVGFQDCSISASTDLPASFLREAQVSSAVT